LKTSYWRLISAVLITAAAGILLKFFGLNTYIILIGFRFHIGCVIPFLFIAGTSLLPYIKKAFVDPPFKRHFIFLLMIFLPLIIVMGGMYLMKIVELGDPEYFYEFGLSSIIDYPLYLVWNSIQLIMLYFFLVSIAETIKEPFIAVFLSLIFLFGYEFFPLEKESLQFIDMGIFVLISIIVSLLIIKYRNVYWFPVILFSLLWSSVLLFGSSSKGIINNLFASQYSNWEGLFDVSKNISPYSIAILVGIALIISISGLGLSRSK